MNKNLLSFFVTGMLTTSSLFAIDDSQPKLAIIDHDSGRSSYFSLEKTVAELTVQVEKLTQLQRQGMLAEEQKTLVIPKLKNFVDVLVQALHLGCLVVIIIAAGQISLKLYKLGQIIYSMASKILLDALPPLEEYVADDIIKPIQWLLSIPASLIPQSIKKAYIDHNKTDPFM